MSDEEIRLAEEYLIKVLYPGSKCKSLDDLRAECYMNKIISQLNLPPTLRSIEGHIIIRPYYYRRSSLL